MMQRGAFVFRRLRFSALLQGQQGPALRTFDLNSSCTSASCVLFHSILLLSPAQGTSFTPAFYAALRNGGHTRIRSSFLSSSLPLFLARLRLQHYEPRLRSSRCSSAFRCVFQTKRKNKSNRRKRCLPRSFLSPGWFVVFLLSFSLQAHGMPLSPCAQARPPLPSSRTDQRVCRCALSRLLSLARNARRNLSFFICLPRFLSFFLSFLFTVLFFQVFQFSNASQITATSVPAVATGARRVLHF